MFEQSEGQDATVYERRQIFSTDKFTSLPTGIASPRHTGRDLEKGMETRRCGAERGRGKLENYWKVPPCGGCVMFLYLQEYDAVIPLLRAQQPLHAGCIEPEEDQHVCISQTSDGTSVTWLDRNERCYCYCWWQQRWQWWWWM